MNIHGVKYDRTFMQSAGRRRQELNRVFQLYVSH